MSAFTTNYPGGKNFLIRLDGLEKRREQVLTAWQRGDETAARDLTQLGRDLQKLEQDALLSNPLLDFDQIVSLEDVIDHVVLTGTGTT